MRNEYCHKTLVYIGFIPLFGRYQPNVEVYRNLMTRDSKLPIIFFPLEIAYLFYAFLNVFSGFSNSSVKAEF